MKKIMALAAAAALLVALTACGAGDVGGADYMAGKESSSQAADSSQASEPSVGETDVEDSLAGLQTYLAGVGAVSGEPKKMQAELIGAKEGAKYQYGFEGNNNVTVELYEFDLENLSQQGEKTLESVKQSGKFTIMDREVEASVSDSGKYLMIYTDTAGGEKHDQHRKEAQDAFKTFKAAG